MESIRRWRKENEYPLRHTYTTLLWLQQTKQKYMKKRRRVGHPKLPCKILVHAYFCAFPKTIASRARLFLLSVLRSRERRRISTLTTYSKGKVASHRKHRLFAKGLGKHANQMRFVFMVSRSMQLRLNGIRPETFPYIPSQRRGVYSHFLPLFFPRPCVQSRRKETTRSRTIGTSYRTRFPRRRMQNS